MALNIAEAAREFKPREKVRIFRIDRRSATERGATLGILRELGLAHEDDVRDAKELLRSIVAMLTSLVKFHELRQDAPQS